MSKLEIAIGSYDQTYMVNYGYTMTYCTRPYLLSSATIVVALASDGGSLDNDVRVVVTGEANVRVVNTYHDDYNRNENLRALQQERR